MQIHRYIVGFMVAGISTVAIGGPITVHCVQGHVRNNSAYQELSLSYSNGKLDSFSYNNEMGPSLSGDYYGCGIGASKWNDVKNDLLKAMSWTENGTNTKIDISADPSNKSLDAEITTQNLEDRIVITFDVKNMMAFCGAQSALPNTITFYKSSKTCAFDGPEL
jgi:hypothetical protein